MTLTEFLLARIDETEDAAVNVYKAGEMTLPWQRYIFAECEAKRRIVEWHANWPVLTETRPRLEVSDDLSSMTARMSQQIAWQTEQEYRERFGDDPPTGPILRFLALPYADHPDYRQEWKP